MVYATVEIEGDIDLNHEIGRLYESDLRELGEAINKRLMKLKKPGIANIEPLAPIDAERAYRALQMLQEGRNEDARWELERAFLPPVSDGFRSAHFVKEFTAAEHSKAVEKSGIAA